MTKTARNLLRLIASALQMIAQQKRLQAAVSMGVTHEFERHGCRLALRARDAVTTLEQASALCANPLNLLLLRSSRRRVTMAADTRRLRSFFL